MLRNVESKDEVNSLNNKECANLHSNVHEAQHGAVGRRFGRATAREQPAIASHPSIKSGQIVGILKQMLTDYEDVAVAQDLNGKTVENGCRSLR